MRTCVAVVLVMGTTTAARGQSSEDVSQLKKDVAALKANVIVLQKELAAMKAGTPVVKKPNFAARFSAASSLSSPTQQQEAFTKLTADAAAWGETKVVYDALAKITSPTALQEMLSKCSLRFAALGLEEDAITLAKRLTSPTEQQRVLGKIARGETDEKP